MFKLGRLLAATMVVAVSCPVFADDLTTCSCQHVREEGYRKVLVDWDDAKIREALKGEEFEAMYTLAQDDPDGQAQWWKDYSEAQSVIASMPSEMRSRFKGMPIAQTIVNPVYSDWAKMSAAHRIQTRQGIEIDSAMSRPYRQQTHSELTGIQAYERGWQFGGLWRPYW
jgi:hypothetical protein